MTDPDTGLSFDQLVALGEIAYWSGQAEFVVAELVTVLLGDDSPRGDAVVAGRAFGDLASIADRLLQRVEGGQTVVDHVSDLERCMQRRNVLLHGFWDSAEVKQGSPISVSIHRRRGRQTHRNVTVNDLRLDAQELADATNLVYFDLLGLRG